MNLLREHPTALRVIGLLVLALLAFWPIAHAGWVWDDDSYVTRNPLLVDPAGILAMWIPGATPQYYPLVFTSFWIETQLLLLLAGDQDALAAIPESSPFLFHITNLALHLGSSILLWRLLARLGVRGAWIAADGDNARQLMELLRSLGPMDLPSDARDVPTRQVTDAALARLVAERTRAAERAARDAWLALPEIARAPNGALRGTLRFR